MPRLLADLSRQIYRNFEVVVVDGRSDDRTVTLAKKFRRRLPRFRLLVSPRRQVCAQRNFGAQAAQGKVLVFMDADCRIGPEFLLGLRYRWETNRAQVLSLWLKPDVTTPGNEALALAVNLFRELQNSLQPSYLLEALVAIDRRAFLASGGFDESVGYGEGSFLIKIMTRRGYVSKVVRDPVWRFSFRRLRQLGLLVMAGKMARLELSKLIGKQYQRNLAKKIYPMGGQQFAYDRETRNRFVDKINRLLEKMAGET